RRGLAVRPGHTWLLNNIGVGLLRQGDLDGAVEAFFHAVAHEPDSAVAHWNLGDALRGQGRLREALTAYRRAHAAGARRPDWRQTAAGKVREAERLIALDGKLEGYLSGTAKPATLAEHVALGELCRLRKHYAAAARLYAGTFADKGV